MKKIVATMMSLGLIAATATAIASDAVVETATEAAQSSTWSKAGGEISEAAHAVGDATVDTSQKAWKATKEGSTKAWDKTKEESGEAWDATKSKSKEMWERGKAKVHDASAPDAPTPEGD